jgi:TRAP-type C4-dicarboxylate transport system permease large subunit
MNSLKGGSEAWITIRVGVISGLILGWINFVIDFLLDQSKYSSPLINQVELALLLLATWLVISACINRLNRLLPEASVAWLFIAGIIAGLLGLILHTSFLWLVLKNVTQSQPDFAWLDYFKSKAVPSLSVSVVVAIFTIITARVEQKTLALALKVLLFIIIGALIYAFM